MATKSIAWNTGSGNINVEYGGSKDGTIVVTSDNNNLYESRSQQIKVRTTDGSNIERTITIQQAAKVRIDISTAIVTAANQTYSGSAKTPIPTVTLNGETIPSSGYDVAYSNNTNAGTATITITGKNDYAGTATGTFTIAKANPNYVAPAARSNLTYSGNSQYLITEGYTTDGTIQYSSNGTSWSTTRPSSTNAGSYTTYWRLVGDSNHNDVASTSLSTTIAKASRTLSFADAYVVLAPSANTTKTATPSAGSGDGAITYSISSTTYATINSSSGKVTAKTSDGSAIVTATIAEGTNYLSATASYNLYVFATTHNFAYTGSVQNIALPPGSYKLQCWGAQGGSNAADSTYGIVAKAGGKGGYAEGVLTIAAQTTLYAFVGGQGSSSGNGGWNCGGGSTGSAAKTDGNTEYLNKMACGGGATDFALVTSSMSYSSRRNNRSNASLLSRIIVAGGGSGGAMCCKRSSGTTTEWQLIGTIDCNVPSGTTVTFNGHNTIINRWSSGVTQTNIQGNPFANGTKVRITINNAESGAYNRVYWADDSSSQDVLSLSTTNSRTYTHNYSANPLGDDAFYRIQVSKNFAGTITIEKEVTIPSTQDTYYSQIGYAGGGINGDGYADSVDDYRGKQDGAGGGAGFGIGENVNFSAVAYCSAAGGAGWYGGGANNSNTASYRVGSSGGGSGFVNTAANAQYRPSGYTGLQLDSGSTTAGSSSFPSTGGGTETGHAGNGYARITRLS